MWNILEADRHGKLRENCVKERKKEKKRKERILVDSCAAFYLEKRVGTRIFAKAFEIRGVDRSRFLL